MTLFQTAAMWALRALLVWTAFETGAGLYAISTEHGAAWSRLAGHDAVMTRLREQTQAKEDAAARAEAARANLSGDIWRLPAASQSELTDAIAAAVRTQLLEFGAQAPIVEARAAETGAVILTAKWREPIESAPAVLFGLAARHPTSALTALQLQRREHLVDIELELTLLAEATAP